MRICRLTLIGVAGLLALHSCCIAGDGDITLCLRATYMTSARVYHSPHSSDEVLRNEYAEVKGLSSYGGEIRYHIPSTFVEVGVGAEFISITRGGQFSLISGNEAYQFPTNEGITMVPVELSAHIVLPFSGEQIRLTMGGGAGFYFGRRTLTIAGIDIPSEKTAFGFGIHVQTGIDYFMTRNLAIRGEIKFRDPQFEVTNRFETMVVSYQGKFLPVEQTEIFSRINIDGIAFTIGIVYYF